MRYRLTPSPYIAVYCQASPASPSVEFLGAALLDATGQEDVRYLPLSVTTLAEAWVATLRVDAVLRSCAA